MSGFLRYSSGIWAYPPVVYDSQGEQNSSVPADNFFAQPLLRRRWIVPHLNSVAKADVGKASGVFNMFRFLGGVSGGSRSCRMSCSSAAAWLSNSAMRSSAQSAPPERQGRSSTQLRTCGTRQDPGSTEMTL